MKENEIEMTEEAEELVKETFPMLWKGIKEDVKDYSREELAEKMYLFGILTYMRMIDIGDKEIMKEMEKDPEIKKVMNDFKKNFENKDFDHKQ